ncbi:MAG: tRNA adenosine(34) deaminase TadA [Ferrimicrobium sp.]
MTSLVSDNQWMEVALQLADEAAADDEVPVGAVIVESGKMIASARNEVRARRDPTAHAELLAIARALAVRDDCYFMNAALYVSLEPCSMCAGALVLTRFREVIYASSDPKAGACGSLLNLCSDPRLNHEILVRRGVLAQESAKRLQSFFMQRRGMGE